MSYTVGTIRAVR